MSTLDFRSRQIRTSKVVASGSTGTNALLLVYPVAASTDLFGGINPAVFGTGSIGSDVFLFVSGAIGSRNTSGSYGTSVFGGDLVVSGSLTVAGVATDNTLATVTTTDTTVTPLWTIELQPNEFRSVDVTVVAKEAGVGNRARYKREFVCRRSGSFAVLDDIVLVTVPDYETDATWGIDVVASGSQVMVVVTGSMSTVRWQSKAFVNDLIF